MPQRLLRPPRPQNKHLEMRASEASLGLEKIRLEGLTTTRARQNARSRTSRLEQPPTQQKPGRAKLLRVSHPRLVTRLTGSLPRTETDSPSTLTVLYVRNQTV
jgi:hypothetical protein